MRFYCANCGVEFESIVAECPNCGETEDVSNDENVKAIHIRVHNLEVEIKKLRDCLQIA